MTEIKLKTVSFEAVRLAAMEAAHSMGPNYIYTKGGVPAPRCFCTYTEQKDHDIVPSCIVGRIMFKLGVTIETLRTRNSSFNPEVAEAWGLRLTKRTVKFLRVMQIAQDGGAAWPFAYDVACWAVDYRTFDTI